MTLRAKDLRKATASFAGFLGCYRLGSLELGLLLPNLALKFLQTGV